MRPAYTLRYAGPPGWRRIPPVTRGTLVLTAAGYLAGIFRLPVEALAAIPERIVPAGEVWRLVTYPIVNIGILAVLFDLLLLWSFGSQLEVEWGSKRYGIFLVLATACAGALGIAAALLIPSSPFGAGIGFAPTLTAAIVAWMLMGPNAPTNFFGVLPMTRKAFALIAVVIVAFGELEQNRSISRLIFVLGGIPLAWFWVRGRRRGAFRLGVPRFLRRRRFRVIEPDDPPKFH